jgi:hypothetical protein
MDDFWTKVKKFLKKSLMWIGTILIMGAILYISFIRFSSYSNGYRAGDIIKFSRKGYVFKTFEGEMNLGGFTDNDQSEVTPTIWAFSVYSGKHEIKQQLITAMENGDRVRLFYKERYARLFWNGDTKYFIYKVEAVE